MCCRWTIAGTLVRIGGCGVLLLGDSGAGKSDLALQLLDRGHQLIADDAVDVREVDGRLEGSCPSRLAGLLEPRGLGIIRVGPVQPSGCGIELIVELVRPSPEEWAGWPRLGSCLANVHIAGHARTAVRLPIAPGRPLALLIERLATERESSPRQENDDDRA
jgi:HPr kinase/phosphorylase